MLHAIDFVIIAGYLLLVFGIAIKYSLGQGIEVFLVNKRGTKLFLLVASIVSTNVGAGWFLSVASEAYATGISFGVAMMMVSTATTITLAALSKRVKRLSDDGKVYTIPELLTQRYRSPAVGTIAALITSAGYLFVTALQFFGIGAVASAVVGFDFRIVLLVAGGLTIVYTAVGGLRGDVIADTISFVVMSLILATIVPIILMHSKFSLSALPPSHLDLFAFGGVSFFVLSIFLGAVSSFIFMEMWQRVFAAESAKTSRNAFLISAVIQPLFIGAGMLLGLAGLVLRTNLDKNSAVFVVMGDLLPTGLRGLGIVAVLAILMTTVNSLVLVGGSTLFVDVIKPRLGSMGERSQLYWVKGLTLAFGCVSLGMAFLIPDFVGLLLMGAFVMLPMCPAIIWAIFSNKPNARAAIASMLIGLIVTLGLLPWMPKTAFGPGVLMSLLVLVAVNLASRRQPQGAPDAQV
ncbi:MAG: sodium:solute symporter family protein [Patescibacteria group bacterium]